MSISRISLTSLIVCLSFCSGLTAQNDQPTESLPYTPSLNVKAMDRSADPCENLYQYACGGWIKNNPVPADQSSWGTYGKAYVDNQQYLWGILEDVAKHQDKRSGTQALLGDYFASCMNEEAIETLGAKPLESGFADIDALSDKAGLAMLIGQLIQQTDSSSFFFAVGSVQDAKDSSKVIGMVYADGLGLPDRDYYLLDEENKVATRKAYQQHLEAMFALLQDPSPDSAAATVMRIETALASATLSRVERRDPHKTYHRKSLDELNLFTPGFNWTALFDTVGLNPSPWLNLNQPVFIEEMARLIETESLEDLKTYLRWGLVNSRAGLLSSHFRDQDFSFYGTHLRGVTEQKPRWRTCVSLVDSQLGEALGREFVERNFPPELRDDARRMSLQIQQAMGERIDNLGWMSEETRKQAREKLEKMRDKIGYPDKWRDYSAIEISRNDFFGNITRATAVDLKRQLDKIGLAVDRDEWVTSPATVNAFYNPSMNDMNFPAGVLMPPLYDPKMDDAPNYGNTGGTIGHELVHGFDDEGRQYDGDGNLRDWWSKEDAAEFEKRADCIREQYAGYRVIDEIFINSQLTSGEDIADLGGLILAWDAWKKETAGQDLKNADNLTPDQRFFVGFAQWACQNERPESLRLHAATDPHSPPIYRINGVVANMSEFAEAFQCPADAALVKPEADICKIW